jgi:hypothetical protein
VSIWGFLGFLGFFGFFWVFFGFFGVFCPEESVFRVFSVSRILWVHPDFKLQSLLPINLFLLIYVQLLIECRIFYFFLKYS